MTIKAVIIDTREPDWVKNLTFGGVPVTKSMLDSGDIWVATDDGQMLVIERKEPNDFLGTLAGDRLFPQAAGLQEMKNQGYWPYLMITGELKIGANGTVYTNRETKWNWNAVQGALLSIQELGIFVTFCGGDTDLEAAVIRLASRSRKPEMLIPSPRIARSLSAQADFLCGLPGIGLDKVVGILTACGNPAWALSILSDTTDKTVMPGVGLGIKNNVRYVLGLKSNERLIIDTTD